MKIKYIYTTYLLLYYYYIKNINIKTKYYKKYVLNVL